MKRKKAMLIITVVFVILLLWGLRSCGYLTIGLTRFAYNEDGAISNNGIYYEPVDLRAPNLQPLQMGKYFAYAKRSDRPYKKIFEVEEQEFSEWIVGQEIGPMFGDYRLWKADSVELPTLQTFGTAELRICEYEDYNKVYTTINDKSIISNIVKSLQDNDNDAEKRWEEFDEEKPEYRMKSKVLFLSPNYPGLCFEYGFVQDAHQEKYLEDVHIGRLYEIGNVLDSYYTE